jgi:hypothetical protein
MSTYIRRRDEPPAAIRCDQCSDFDHDGFAMPAPQDDQRPDAVRVWAPVVGGVCLVCGKDC